MLEIIGWIGSVSLAVCGIPQAIKCYRDGHAHGLSWMFLLLFFIGALCSLIYVLPLLKWPLIFNYIFSMSSFGLVLRYKL